MASGVVGSLVVKLSAATADFTAPLKKAGDDTKVMADQTQANLQKVSQSSQLNTDKIKGHLTGVVGGFQNLAATIAPSFAGISDLISSAMSPGTLGLGAIAAGFAFIQHEATKARSILEQSKKLGLDSTIYQELGIAAKKVDMDIEQVSTSIQKMRAAVVSDEKIVLFKELGLDPAKLHLEDTNNIMKDIGKAILNIKDPLQRVKMEMEMFGKAGKDIEPLLRQLERLDKFKGKTVNDDQLRAMEKMKVGTTDFGMKAAGNFSQMAVNQFNPGSPTDYIKSTVDMINMATTGQGLIWGKDIEANELTKIENNHERRKDASDQKAQRILELTKKQQAELKKKEDYLKDQMTSMQEKVFKATHSEFESRLYDYQNDLTKHGITGDEAAAAVKKFTDLDNQLVEAEKKKKDALEATNKTKEHAKAMEAYGESLKKTINPLSEYTEKLKKLREWQQFMGVNADKGLIAEEEKKLRKEAIAGMAKEHGEAAPGYSSALMEGSAASQSARFAARYGNNGKNTVDEKKIDLATKQVNSLQSIDRKVTPQITSL